MLEFLTGVWLLVAHNAFGAINDFLGKAVFDFRIVYVWSVF
jgi:hypothetical protein